MHIVYKVYSTMIRFLVIALLGICCITGAGCEDQTNHDIPECKDGYEKVENSTMCMVDSMDYVSGGVTAEDIQIILKEHNKYRSGVKPPATNMMKVYWDEELARLADKWSRQCQTGHDLERYMPKYNTRSGQNAAAGYFLWKGAIKGWYNEVKLYKYGEDPNVYLGPGGWIKVGHYTQVVTDTVMLVGCGFSECTSGYNRYYVCNYLTGQSSIPKPYVVGPRCSACPGSCKNGLCDCQDKFCFHGGKLNINTCKCDCVAPWFGPKCLDHPCGGKICKHGGKLDTDTCTCTCAYPYKGEVCDTVDCGNRLDPSYCGPSWTSGMCEYAQVQDKCPVMCGICEAPCKGKICQNAGMLDVDSCSCRCPKIFTGEHCELTNCTGHIESAYCYTNDASYCEKYINGPSNCPVLCGICEEPCGGKRCQNDGELQLNNCTCKCPSIYKGDTCDKLHCDGHKDNSLCGLVYTVSECSKYPSVKNMCANLCGVCVPSVCNGKVCQNRGTLNEKTCECACETYYAGDLCESENCPGKPDPSLCGSGWPASFCQYKNVPPHCPIMCGLCQPICGGKRCENDGKLNIDNCKCSCKKKFFGDTCEHFKCPAKDPYYCGGKWPVEYCKDYANVQWDCPYMCGTCTS